MSSRYGKLLFTDCSHHLAVGTSDSDSELGELLRDTLEPGTSPVQSLTSDYPLTAGADRITEKAFYETAEDMEDVVDELQALVEERLPWLKDDISSSESSNPRTPSPDIKLEDISASEEAAWGDPTPKLLNEAFEFRDYMYDDPYLNPPILGLRVQI